MQACKSSHFTEYQCEKNIYIFISVNKSTQNGDVKKNVIISYK